MSIEEIRAFRNARPFTPFEVILRDGKIIRVVRPERIAIAPWGRLGIFQNSVPFTPHVDEVAEVRVMVDAA